MKIEQPFTFVYAANLVLNFFLDVADINFAINTLQFG